MSNSLEEQFTESNAQTDETASSFAANQDCLTHVSDGGNTLLGPLAGPSITRAQTSQSHGISMGASHHMFTEACSVSSENVITDIHQQHFDHDKSKGNQNLPTHYVIVDEPIDLHGFGDFTGLQMQSVSNLCLSNDMSSDSNVLNTPRPEEKDTNEFSSIDLLVSHSNLDHESNKLPYKNQKPSTDKMMENEFGLNSECLPKPGEPSSEIGLPTSYDYCLEDFPDNRRKDQVIRNNVNNSIESQNEEEAAIQSSDGDFTLAEPNQPVCSSIDDIASLFRSQSENQSPGGLENNVSVSENFQQTQACGTGNSFNANKISSVDSTEVKDKEEKEKTMFSENLGLMPAQVPGSVAKNPVKKIRTRKSSKPSVKITINESLEAPVEGHKHSRGPYKCGRCTKTFANICKLHDHMLDSHSEGSYTYDHSVRTAFPKCDSVCSTEPKQNKNKKSPPANSKNPLSIKLKIPAIKIKPKNMKIESAPKLKRKRGRPRKNIEPKIDNESKENIEIVIENDIVGQVEELKDHLSEDYFDDMDQEMTEYPDLTFSDHEDLKIDNVKSYSATVDTSKSDEHLEPLDESESKNKIYPAKSDLASPETNNSIKRVRKRKMSIPRKVMPVEMATKKYKKEKKFKCEFCRATFINSTGLVRHEENKHSELMEFDCDECGKKFMRADTLDWHKLKNHTKDEQKREAEQGEEEGTEWKGKKGVRKRRKNPPTERVCEVCNQIVLSSKINVHMRLHTGERPFICHICGKGLISDKKLKRHLQIHNEVCRHTCEVCGQGFSMKYRLRAHMFVHTGHKPFLCSVCGAEFNNSTSLLHHHRTVHLGDKRFECKICGGRYGKKSQLDEHMFCHSDERTQTCRYCGKCFKHSKSLRRHEMTHVTDQKFACDQCDSKFSRKDNLERHKLCHLESALHCSYCKKKFREREPLIEHEKFHINSRRFQCQICKDKFLDESYFYGHMEKNHGVTKDMVPMINALANSPEKTSKSRKSADSGQTSAVETLKVPTVSPASSSAVDTLNLSMSVAGILPSSTPEMSVLNGIQSILGAQSVSVGTQSNLSTSPNAGSMNAVRLLNHQINGGFSVSGNVLSVSDLQRVSLVNPATEGTGLRLDDAGLQLGLVTGEGVGLHDQQQLMQEAISSGLQLHGQGFRLQNMY